MTRRQLAAALLPAVAATAQTEDPLIQAKQSVARNGEALSKFKIDMALEPAFQFKA